MSNNISIEISKTYNEHFSLSAKFYNDNLYDDNLYNDNFYDDNNLYDDFPKNGGGVPGFLGSLKISPCEERRLKETQNLKCEDRRFQNFPVLKTEDLAT